MDCPSSDALNAWRVGTLDETRRSGVSRHLEACPRCTAVASTLSPVAVAAPAEPELGARLGRFVLTRRLGAGAMGVVFAARDPQLGRQVAVKVLRGSPSPHARARLLREAQAMARLQHPNVVVVFEAGEVGDQVFVVMELCDGTSLDAWLAARRPGWREVLDLYLQAGRGLAAAHAAGIVHRDFKPSNVLVSADGRAHVGDFGLARDLGEPPEPPEPASHEERSPELTATGAVLGTPGFMAPEQRRGERASAVADQYSFCVAVCEGLYGVRPTDDAPPPPPPGSKVPAGVRRALVRGLASRPEARFPTMTALVDALGAAGRPRRVAPLVAGGVALLASGALAAALVAPRGSATEPCAGIETRLAGVWDAPARAAIHAAFVATGVEGAERRFQRVAQLLDDYAASWVERSAALCRQPASETRSRRQACLDRRRDQLLAWTGVMREADAARVKGAVESAAARDSLEACDDAEPPVAPVPADPALAARVAALRAQLDRLSIRDTAGEAKAALEGFTALRPAVAALGYRPVEAELLESLGVAQMNVGDNDAAVATFEELRRLADELRYDHLRAAAWVYLVRAHAWRYHPAEAHAAARDAESALRPMSGRDAEQLRLALAANRADAYWDERKFPEALALSTEALHGTERLLGPMHPSLSHRLKQQGSLLRLSGRLDEAEAAYHRALAILAGHDVTDGAMVPELMVNLGDIANRRGDPAAALGWYQQAQPLLEAAFGATHLHPHLNLVNLAQQLVSLGRFSEARDAAERARGVMEARLPPAHPHLGELYAILGQAELGRGDPRAARGWLERALAIQEKAPSMAPEEVASTRAALEKARTSR